MSVWLEPGDQNTSSGSMVDVAFKIDCQRLPADHASALTKALCKTLPWLADLKNTGIHPVHVAGSQNGWQRPEIEDNEELLLSKRTRLRIRVNKKYVDELINGLKDVTLSIDGYPLKVMEGRTNPLHSSATLFSRYTAYGDINTDDEEVFTRRIIEECEQLGFSPTKLLCGKSHLVSTNNGKITTRSLLIADIPIEKSLTLQDNGLGDHRLIGCGLLIPHKDTAAVN